MTFALRCVWAQWLASLLFPVPSTMLGTNLTLRKGWTELRSCYLALLNLSNDFPVTQINFLLHLHFRLCYDAFTENMAGENQLLERRRLYHCAAYNCAISVICCVFNELKFYQGFLFSEKPEKVSHSLGVYCCCHYRISKIRLHQLKLYCNLYHIIIDVVLLVPHIYKAEVLLNELVSSIIFVVASVLRTPLFRYFYVILWIHRTCLFLKIW